jgi:DNA polymerase-3 subunit gamma/tau
MSDGATAPLNLDEIHKAWPELIRKVGPGLGWRLSQAEPIACDGLDSLVIGAKPGYNTVADPCGSADALRKIEQSLQRMFRRTIRVRYDASLGGAVHSPGTGSGSGPGPGGAEPRRSDLAAADPLIKKVVELFEARPLHMEYEEEAGPASSASP